MRKIFFIIAILAVIMLVNQCKPAPGSNHISFDWKLIARLKDMDTVSIGVAGAINGVSQHAFVVAGGSNFPDEMPWNGGRKVYLNKIHVLLKEGDQYSWDNNITATLPENLAYCGYTSATKGIVCIGGENENGLSDKSFILKLDTINNTVHFDSLPNFPLALTNIAVTHDDNTVYALGGDARNHSSNSFFSINLDHTDPQWEQLPDLPVALANCIAVVQNKDKDKSVYVIGGRTKTPSGISLLHHTAFAFNISTKSWKKLADISDGENTINLSAAAGAAVGNEYIVAFGGDNGVVFHQIETLMAEKARADDPAEKDTMAARIKILDTHHQGFYKGILVYNTLANKWTKIGALPFTAHVTTEAVKWNGDIIISNGEIKPGVRTPDIMLGKLKL